MPVLLLALLPAAFAAEEKPPYDKQVSVTISPIHLTLPIVELTAEVRAADKAGVAAIAGVGKASGYPAWELGAQGRYYLLGSFDHGMQIGGEVLYLHMSTNQGAVQASGAGGAVGPFIGYKIAARFGLTFDVQLGAEYLFATANASNGASTATTSDSRLVPLLNLNLGWSF